MQDISFNGVAQQAKKYRTDLQQKFSEIIERGIFLNGPEEEAFVQRWASYFQQQGKEQFVVTTGSGHDALLLALQSLHLKRKDEVIFPVNAYPTAFPIALTGARPVPVDVDKYGLIDIKEIARHLSDKTRAIVLVHLYGLVVDIEQVRKLIAGRDITIIEDCAQALGSQYKDEYIGSHGDIGCFSFYPTKNVGTLGDGGTIMTPHREIYDFVVAAKSYGEKERYKSEFISGHSRLAELQAGALNVCLSNFHTEKKKRKEVVAYYQEKLKKYELPSVIYHNHLSEPLLHLLVIRSKRRDDLQKYLAAHQIPTAIHYPFPIHLIDAFQFLQYKKGDFPQAEKLAKEILSLPYHAYLNKKEISYIVSSIRQFYDDSK